MLLEMYNGSRPRVLDVFGGNGTIALEAGRLGCSVDTLDINPLAFFAQKCLLEYSQVQSNLPELVEKYGKQLLGKLRAETKSLYRRGHAKHPFEQRIVFLWGQTVKCSNSSCQKTISITGNHWISKKKNHRVFLLHYPEIQSGTYFSKLLFNPTENVSTKRWRPVKGILCPFCGRRYKRQQFKELASQTLHEELLCVRLKVGNSKTYVLPDHLEDFFPSQDELQSEISKELDSIGFALPNIELPQWSGFVNPPIYGIKTYIQLFNPRQLVVLLKMIRGLRETHKTLVNSGYSKEVATAVIVVLSGFIDQLVDWNCRLSMWIEENQQIGRALSGPGIPMLWSYAESDPFSKAPANLYAKLERIVRALKAIPKFTSSINVHMLSATNLPFENGTFDAIVTDPPYADNLFYSSLSECIYVWKRMVFLDILPEIFSRPNIPREDQIVAKRYKYPFKEAMNLYEEQLTKALREATRVLKKEGILSFFFAHSTLEAWELIIRAFKRAGLKITGGWPLFLERNARPRGMTGEAVNASIVITARRKTMEAQTRDWSDVKEQIKMEISKFRRELTFLGLDDIDMAFACFAKVVGILGMSDEITERNKSLTIRDCLERSVHIVKTLYPSFSLKER